MQDRLRKSLGVFSKEMTKRAGGQSVTSGRGHSHSLFSDAPRISIPVRHAISIGYAMSTDSCRVCWPVHLQDGTGAVSAFEIHLCRLAEQDGMPQSQPQ